MFNRCGCDCCAVCIEHVLCITLSSVCSWILLHCKLNESYLQYVKGDLFLKNLLENTKRYQTFFASSADKMLDATLPNSIRPTVTIQQDTFDVLMNQVS